MKKQFSEIVTIVQTRVGSSRLHGKVMMPLLNKPLFVRQVERINASKLKGTVIVATTTNEEDNAIEKICHDENILCYRGSEHDLLKRHYDAAQKMNADAVVKIPSDCPLIDPKVIDRVIGYFLEHEYDYVSNLHPATYPDGNDVEIMSMSALRIAHENAELDFEREHTTPYIWEHQQIFNIRNISMEDGQDYSMTHRWTIDYAEDYEFIKKVFETLYPQNPTFGIHDILKLLAQRPELLDINAHFAGVNWYRHHLNELKTIKPEQTKIIAE